MRSPFRILLVPECCIIKLACTVADNSVSFLFFFFFFFLIAVASTQQALKPRPHIGFLSRPWVDCMVIKSREGTSFYYVCKHPHEYY